MFGSLFQKSWQPVAFLCKCKLLSMWQCKSEWKRERTSKIESEKRDWNLCLYANRDESRAWLHNNHERCEFHEYKYIDRYMYSYIYVKLRIIITKSIMAITKIITEVLQNRFIGSENQRQRLYNNTAPHRHTALPKKSPIWPHTTPSIMRTEGKRAQWL